MAALPTTTAAFASGATEAQFKTFLTGQRDFLAGLLGTDGLPATARAALGVSAVTVTSFNARTGSVTLTYADVTGALAFTPAVDSHTHSSFVSINMAHDAIGSLCFAYAPGNSGSGLVAGSTYAGSTITPAGVGLSGPIGSGTLTGTWRQLGYRNMSASNNTATLFQRIA